VKNGVLDRKKLGRIVFSHTEALEKLNLITHQAIKDKVTTLLSPDTKLAAIDAIALFESGLSELCQLTVAVIAPAQDRITRLMARDGITEEYAKLRIQAQKSDHWFRQNCDYVLENTGTAPQFHAKCLAFFQELVIMNTETK